jgi:hypothetical protein
MERASCSVRAYAEAFKVPFDDAHAIFKRHGRKDSQRTPHTVSVKALAGKARRVTLKKGCTVERFIREHPTGTFICRKAGHMFTITDGSTNDGTSALARITRYWIVR